MDGLASVEVEPLPKSHNQEVAPVDKSLKLTIIGEQPAIMSDWKFAVGICAKQ